MDTAITTLEMCAGYGGIGLGLKNIFGERMRTLAYCELEGFAQANLVSKMEKGLMDVAPIWNDLKTFPYESFHGLVDILIAGYPCQPFSSAGKRLGTEDPRHLWPYIADGIRLMRPQMCFFENVEGHISMGLSSVVSDLEELGYKVSWGIFSAAEVGAPHRRKRVFILAYSADWRGKSLHDWNSKSTDVIRCCSWPSHPGEPQHGWEPRRVVDSKNGGQQENDSLSKETGRGATESCSSNGGSSSVGDTKHNGSHQCGADTGGAESSSKQGRLQKFEGGSASVGDAEGGMPRQSIAGDWREGVGGAGEASEAEWQTQPTLGGDADGSASGLDYAQLQDADSAMREDHAGTVGGAMANTVCGWGQQTRGECGCREVDSDQRPEKVSGNKQATFPYNESDDGGASYEKLCITCDNRTDELRLLGNGVVPATAERAFRTLLNELIP